MTIPVCSSTEKCDFHRDGGSKREKCWGLCDRRGCRALATTEVGPAGRTLCDRHATPRRPGPPVTTGSKAERVVAFRLGSTVRRRAEAAAERECVTVGELARRTLVAYLDTGTAPD